MHVATTVTMVSMITVMLSSQKPTVIWNGPVTSQRHDRPCSDEAQCQCGSCRPRMNFPKSTRASTAQDAIAPVASQSPPRGSLRPQKMITRPAASGTRKSARQMRARTGSVSCIRSVPQAVGAGDVDAAEVVEDAQHDGQRDGRLG